MVAPSWPTSTTESLDWEPSHPDLIPRSRWREVTSPYVATIIPQIADIDSIPIPGSLAADLTDAEAEIARFDERIGSRLAAFSVVALRTEAAASSQIENLTASASAIAVAEHATPTTSPVKPNAELIVANVATLAKAISGSRRITADEIILIQQVLLESSAPKITGSFRQEQVWIGGTSYSPHGADHVAPHHTRVPRSIADLADFIARDDLPHLAQIAIAHAHFENIHPFPDGNGRTGRVIVQRMLQASGLTRHSLVPLSAGLLGSTDTYFEALNQYREGNLSPILEVFVAATFDAIANSTTLANELTEIHGRWKAMISARSDSAIWRALELCATRTAITADTLVSELEVSSPNAYRQIEKLTEVGVLHQNSNARRNRVWLVTDVVAAVEAFMERSTR